MDVHVATNLFNSIDEGLKSTLIVGTAQVMTGLGAVFGSVWTMTFAIKSIYWLFQGMTEIFRDVVFSIIKMGVIVGFAFNVPWYIEHIVPIVTGLPVWMGGILSGQTGSQVNQVDTLISVYITSLDSLVDSMSFPLTDLEVLVVSCLVIAFYLMGGLPFIAVAVGTLITLKAATTVLLVIGPVFIAFLLFEQTRQWFSGWLSVIAGFMLTQIMFSVVLGLEIGYINQFVVQSGSIPITILSAFEVLITFGAFTLLAAQLPNYAASIMGGASSDTTGVGGIVGKALGVSTAMKFAKFMGKQRFSRGNQIS